MRLSPISLIMDIADHGYRTECPPMQNNNMDVIDSIICKSSFTAEKKYSKQNRKKLPSAEELGQRNGFKI
jgi:hypothetical protein